MNEFQTKLFQDLKHLVATNEAFLSKEQVLDDVRYLVFDYRLATHTDFLLPNARESRGIMFELGEDGNPVHLACFMPQKFFNYGEGDTLKLDVSDANIDGVMDKLDGSIISTFLHKGELRLKSKTSLHSDHVKQATAWLKRPENVQFYNVLELLTMNGWSVHMELTSPDLRIVVGYDEIRLTILSMRRRECGMMASKQDVQAVLETEDDRDARFYMQVALDNWVPDYSAAEMLYKVADAVGLDQAPANIKEFIANVKHATGIEGYIVRLKCGEHVKIKCDWYCALHHTKDSVSAPRRLFECVVNGGSDDLKGMFGDDKLTIARIEDMEEKVKTTFNRIVKTVEDFYEENKGLDRKAYAIKASGINDGFMSLKMNLFLGKENDYKEYALKHMELFGVNVHQVYETIEE